MDRLEMFEVVKVTEEVESKYSQKETMTPKKRKSKVQEDSTERPKKPRSAYLLYYFDVHQIMQLGIPNLPQSEINKRISESWKRLSVAEKSYYLEKAKLEKEGMDTSALSPSKDLPGFRKILPRASYYVLSKGCSSNHQAGSSQSEQGVESLDGPAGEAVPSVSVTQESQFTPLGLSEEIELSEHSVIVEDIAEETAEMSPSSAVQGIPPSSSTSLSIKGLSSTDSYAANTTTQTGNETTAAGGEYCNAVMQQTQGEPAQMVAIIPTQNLLETRSLAGVGTVGPVMMVSVGGGVEQSAKPSYKMSAKTYTRRGHGRCLNPGCSFMYVTRHKPPTCPACGNHLGGKWIPAAKKTEENETPERKKQETLKSKSNQSSQSTAHVPQKSKADVKTNITTNSREAQRSFKKQHALAAPPPPGGGSIKTEVQTGQLKNNSKNTVMESQGRSTAAVQKRPMRPILPACNNNPGQALFQFITVLPEKGKCQSTNNNKSASGPQESFSGLKPSTLKQLGLTVPGATTAQDPDSADRNKSVSQTDKMVNVLSLVPYKRPTVSSFDLGLSTARGRGRCRNPSCDYMYKNRHKPALCPKCGFELTQKKTKATKSESLLDPYQALSPAQKEIQRQSTLQLLRGSLQIPESEADLQETLSFIQELNRLQIVLFQQSDQQRDDGGEAETLVESGWPQFYESAATHCSLCNYPLFKGSQSTVAGQEDCWLLTETLMQTASLQLKVCLNLQCLALHSFTDLHPGLFNIGNRLLVSIDLFLKIRAGIRLGQSPSQAVRTVLDHAPNHPIHSLNPDESCRMQELLLSGYWAFECLTVRDYNDMICGVCGVAPKVEIAQRHTENVLELKNVEFTWPEVSVSDEVHVDDFWLTMESEAIEQAAFPADIPITRVDASIIAPFIPPLMRSAVVINTEKDKVPSQTPCSGEPSVLVRLIHDGELRLGQIEDHTEDELRAILDRCGATASPGSTKAELLASLVSLYTLVHGGLPTASQPPAHVTAGKLSKVCPHKVVCSSKYLVRGETARDHVDLLLSSRYWPPVYVCDSPRQVALCTDMQYPELATQMWGRNQGCFSDPFEKPELVSCEELQEQPYRVDLSMVVENQQVHPITRSTSCWLVHPPPARQPPTPEHHSMRLCPDLEPYVGLAAELEAEGEGKEMEDGSGKRAMVFNNTAYYYLYNRLVDFLTSRDIVSQQISQVVKACQPGEVVIRDALYRLGMAQIKTEKDDDEGSGPEAKEDETETYEVVLSDD